MSKLKMAALSLSAALCGPSMAADTSGFYAGLEVGTWAQRNSSFKDPAVVILTGGYRLNPYFAGEIGLYAPGYSKIDYGGGDTVTAKQSAFKVAAVGILPLDPVVELFGKAGLTTIYGQQEGTGAYATTYSETTSNVMYGLGAQFHLARHFVLRVQYEALGQRKLAPGATAVDITVPSVGLMYAF
jgi:hypothetical protein